MTPRSVLSHLQALSRDARGSVAIQIGILMIVLIGMASLGIETGTLYLHQRRMQAAADAAAVSAARARATGRPADYRTEAAAVASTFGYTAGVDGTTVTVHSPPEHGPHSGDDKAVAVIVSQRQSPGLARPFYTRDFVVGARAVASVGGGPAYCVLQLDPDAHAGFSMNHGARVTLENCGVAVDSGDRHALYLENGSRLDAPEVSVVGDAALGNGAGIDPAEALARGQPSVPDPYAGVPVPAYSGCGNGDGRTYNHGDWVLTPGVFCNGVRFRNAARVTLQPGLYVVDRGTFEVDGGARLTGDGVTIVLTSRDGEHPATVDIAAGAEIALTAPATGPTAGIVFFGDRLRPGDHDVNSFKGGASLDVAGAIYFPTAAVAFENGANNSAACTQLIAATIDLEGGSRLRNTCPLGVLPIVGGAGGGASELVE